MESTIKVNIKWGKQFLKDVEISLSQNPVEFQNKVYALTNVPVSKQKLFVKMKQIKTSKKW